MMITQHMSDSEVGILVLCIIVTIIFAKEIREFISFLFMLMAGLLVLVFSWLVYGSFAMLGLAIRLIERFSK